MAEVSDLDEEAARQLQGELTSIISKIFDAKSRRPILKRLNADSSWLLSLPYPDKFKAPPGRCRFNIIIDPWLHGSQTDLAYWFSTQWHAIRPDIESIDELNTLLGGAETEALNTTSISSSEHAKSLKPVDNFIDVVVCSHEFTDHCHKETLQTIRKDVPVFAPHKAAQMVRSWKHFQSVTTIPVISDRVNWRTLRQPPLPAFINFARIETKDEALAKLHTVFVVFMDLGGSSGAESVLYTPHGIDVSEIDFLTRSDPPVTTLALLHGLHHVSIALAGSTINLGKGNAIKLQRLLRSRYWVATHDEVKTARGLISLLLRYKRQDANLPAKHQAEDKVFDPELAFIALENGDCLVLESE